MDRPTRIGSVLLFRWKSLVHAWRNCWSSPEQDHARCSYESVFALEGHRSSKGLKWIKERLNGIKHG